jgi:hypothetical protein
MSVRIMIAEEETVVSFLAKPLILMDEKYLV